MASNYTITKVEGKLSITKITAPIIVTANSPTKTYDGTELKDSGFSYTQNVLQGKDTISATIVGEQTNAGTSENKVTAVTIKREDVDVTSNYTLGTHVSGTLTVNKRTVDLS